MLTESIAFISLETSRQTTLSQIFVTKPSCGHGIIQTICLITKTKVHSLKLQIKQGCRNLISIPFLRLYHITSWAISMKLNSQHKVKVAKSNHCNLRLTLVQLQVCYVFRLLDKGSSATSNQKDKDNSEKDSPSKLWKDSFIWNTLPTQRTRRVIVDIDNRFPHNVLKILTIYALSGKKFMSLKFINRRRMTGPIERTDEN